MLFATLVWARYTALRLTLPARYRRMSLPALLSSIEGDARVSASGSPPVAVQGLEAGFRRIDGVLARVPGLPGTCLFRALGRYGALVSAGYDAVLHLGLEPAPGPDLVGHAWVAVAGVPLDDDARGYVATFVHSLERRGAPSEPPRAGRGP